MIVDTSGNVITAPTRMPFPLRLNPTDEVEVTNDGTVIFYAGWYETITKYHLKLKDSSNPPPEPTPKPSSAPSPSCVDCGPPSDSNPSPSPSINPTFFSTGNVHVNYYDVNLDTLPEEGLKSLTPYSDGYVENIDFVLTPSGFATSGRKRYVAALFSGKLY